MNLFLRPRDTTRFLNYGIFGRKAHAGPSVSLRSISKQRINLPKKALENTVPRYMPQLTSNIVTPEVLEKISEKKHVDKSEFVKPSKKEALLKLNAMKKQLKVDRREFCDHIRYESGIPNTFPESVMSYSQMERPLVPASPLSDSEYPYKYYEITLARSPHGIDQHCRKKLVYMGLYKKGDTTWWKVHPFSAARIIELRHLLEMRLVNDLPKKIYIVGFNEEFVLQNLLKTLLDPPPFVQRAIIPKTFSTVQSDTQTENIVEMRALLSREFGFNRMEKLSRKDLIYTSYSEKVFQEAKKLP